MTPLEGENKMKAIVSFIAGISKDDSNKSVTFCVLCLSFCTLMLCDVISNDVIVFHSVFMVDHAWLYEPQYAEMQLTHVPGLATRMGRLMGILSEAAYSRRTSQAATDLTSQCEALDDKLHGQNLGSHDLDTVLELPVGDVAISDDMMGSHDPPSPGADSVSFDIPDDVLVAKVLEKMWSYNNSLISPVVSVTF